MSIEHPWELEEDVIVSGANRDLLEWAINSELGRTYVIAPLSVGALTGEQKLSNAIGLCHHWGVGPRNAHEAILTLWEKEAGFGPYPLRPQALDELERSGAFYQEYREHTVHQLRVFLLGLFLYETSQRLREALHQEIRVDLAGEAESWCEGRFKDEAILRWKAAALAHDVGYVLETPETDPSFAKARETDASKEVGTDHNWSWLQVRLNDCLEHPFSSQGHLLDLADEKRYEGEGLSKITLTQADDLERILKKGAGEYLQAHAQRAGLGEERNGQTALKRYYELCRTEELSGGRPRFRDHGIVSALLLLNTQDAFRKRASDILGLPSEVVPNEHRESVAAAMNAADLVHSRRTMWAAAAAVSLHNVNLVDMKKELYRSRDLAPGQYRLGLNTTPLALLLGLADTLQNWDRPLFRSSRATDKKLLAGIDIRLRPENGRLGLSWTSDRKLKDGGRDPEGEYQQLLRRLKPYLDGASIDELLTWSQPQLLDDALEEDIYRLNFGALPSRQRNDQKLTVQQRLEVIRAAYRTNPPVNHVIDDVFQLTSERTGAIDRLLAKKVASNPDEPTNLLSRRLTILCGYVSPLRLLTGLVTTLDDSWPDLVQAYQKLAGESDSLQDFHLFITFCWLAWGPSVDLMPLCTDKTQPLKVLQVSLGDEANSLPLIVAERRWAATLKPALKRKGEHGVSVRLANAILVNPSNDQFFARLTSRQGSTELLAGLFEDNIALYCGPEATIEVQEDEECGYYTTAYVWLMLELIDMPPGTEGDGLAPETTSLPPLRPGKVVPFFEHANLASRDGLDFLQRCLVRKALHHTIKCAEYEPYQKTGYYRYATALFDDDIAGNGGLTATPAVSIFQQEFARLTAEDQSKVEGRLWIPPVNQRRTGKDVLQFVQSLQQWVESAVVAPIVPSASGVHSK